MAEIEAVAVADPVPTGDAGVADSASSTEIDYSKQSDDDILNLGSEDVSAVEPASEDTTAAPVVEEKPVVAAKPEEEETFTEEPESLARLYSKNPELKGALDKIFEAHPKARSAWFRGSQLNDVFENVAEARELRGLFPTTDMARRASSAVAILSQLDQEVTDSPEKFAQRLAQGNPENFARLVESSRRVLFDKNPQAYAEAIGNPVINDVFMNLVDMASQNGDEPLQAALQIIADRTGMQQPGAKPAKPANLDPRIKQYEDLKQRAQALRQETSQAFSSAVDGAYWDGLSKEIAAAVGKPEAMSDNAIKRICSDVLESVTSQIGSRNDLRPTYEQLKRNGDLSEAHKANAANFLLSYAKQLVGPAARKTISEWTRDFVQQNQADIKKIDAKPKNKDVGAGSGKNAPTPKGTGRVDYKKYSDDDIINGRANL